MMKVTDKVSLRLVSLDMALRRYHNDSRNICEVLETADMFANYIQGESKLKEYNPDDNPLVVVNQNNNYPYEEEDENDFLN